MGNPVNKSKLEADTCSYLETWEGMCELCTIDVDLSLIGLQSDTSFFETTVWCTNAALKNLAYFRQFNEESPL